MLPPNLLLVWMLVLLSTTVSTAPVEEKEVEEVEVTEEGEGELSEEEEDEDDSQSQDKIEGAPGVHQASSAAGSGVSGSQSAPAVKQDGTAGGDTGSASSPGSAGSPDPVGSPGLDSSSGSGTRDPPGERPAPSHVDPNGPDGADSESNGNGHKLLNGGGGTGGGGGDGSNSQTGVLASYGYGGGDYIDYTGGLLRPDSVVNIEGQLTPPTHLHTSIPVIGQGVTAAPGEDHSRLDSPAGHHPDISIHHSRPDLSDLNSANHQSGSAHSAGEASLSSSSFSSSSSSSSSSHSEAAGEQTDGADSAVPLGNGRLTLLTETHTATTDRLAPVSDLQTHLTDGGESVTSFQGDLTASGLGLSHDVTESSPTILHSQSADATHHLNAVSGVYSQSDLVTMATERTGTDTAAADWTGTPDSSNAAGTEHTPGSVTEQYVPSGQGPEGAENVELEDTC